MDRSRYDLAFLFLLPTHMRMVNFHSDLDVLAPDGEQYDVTKLEAACVVIRFEAQKHSKTLKNICLSVLMRSVFRR